MQRRTRRRGTRSRRRTGSSCRAALACAGRRAWSCATQYAREHRRPYFGICLGMQVAVIEFARNVLGLKVGRSPGTARLGGACFFDCLRNLQVLATSVTTEVFCDLRVFEVGANCQKQVPLSMGRQVR